MHFELLGPIVQIETFAVGSRIREIARLRKFYGNGRGGSGKASRRFGSLMDPSTSLKFIGMKRQG